MFPDTSYALKLHIKVHNQELDMREPQFSSFYKLSTQKKQGGNINIGGMALALGLAASRLL